MQAHRSLIRHENLREGQPGGSEVWEGELNITRRQRWAAHFTFAISVKPSQKPFEFNASSPFKNVYMYGMTSTKLS